MFVDSTFYGNRDFISMEAKRHLAFIQQLVTGVNNFSAVTSSRHLFHYFPKLVGHLRFLSIIFNCTSQHDHLSWYADLRIPIIRTRQYNSISTLIRGFKLVHRVRFSTFSTVFLRGAVVMHL